MNWIIGLIRNIKIIPLVTGIATALLLISIYLNIGMRYKREINRLQFNLKVSNVGTTIWKNKFNDFVAEASASQMKLGEIIKSNNEEIQTLVTKSKQQGIKIKNLEYLVSIGSDFNMDSIVPIVLDTVHFTRDNYIYIDSISVGDFRLKRTQLINSLESHYNISYTPTLYLSISHYKDGNWKLRNIFHKRDIRYKATVSSSDNLLKPSNIQIIKAE